MSCLICGGAEGKFVQSKRIDSIIDASRQRDDGLHVKIDKDTTHILCHSNCLSTYCSKHHIQRLISKREQPEYETTHSSKRLRSQETFNFMEHCLFCGEECCIIRPKKHPDRWKEAYLCRTVESGNINFKDKIMKHAKEREDDWGRDVAFRTSGAVSDLHAVEARYHVDCRARFFYDTPAASSNVNQTDRPLADLVKLMTSDRTKIWNSQDVHETYHSLGGMQLSRRCLVQYLSNHLNPDLLVLSSPGVASILIFRSKSASLLRIIDDTDIDKCQRNISYIADLIKDDCPSWNPLYFDARISLKESLKQCSNTLMLLLAAISPSLDSTMPAVMIGHIVTSAITGHATNLQIALSVLLDKQRTVNDKFHEFGVTTSYNELRRFRISAAVAAHNDRRGLAKFDSSKGLIQVSADNFDAQISSQNGRKSTHGLAMIVTHTKNSHIGNVCTESDQMKIRRLQEDDIKARHLNLGDVEIHRYAGPKKPDMPDYFGQRVVVSLKVLATLNLQQRRAVVMDFKFLKAVLTDNKVPEYGGFNTKWTHDDNGSVRSKTNIVYVPMLDMIPSEPDTMKTAMIEAQELTFKTGQEWTIFTNDQQLYKVALHITWVDRDLFSNFIPRLGGMHMLMSFVGAVGVLMAGTGLEEILQSTFSSVPKMLIGKKFPQNVRALRIIAEEILRPILEDSLVQTADDFAGKLSECRKSTMTTQLWIDCLVTPVMIMMAYIRAEREGLWPLHLDCVNKMLPYFFASAHFNYARYGLVYLRSMQRLPDSLLEKFLDGQHVMRHKDGLWNGVWSDMFIESTYMRYGHGPGGIIGSTLNQHTLSIWALSLGTLGQIKHDLAMMVDGETEDVITVHAEEHKLRVKHDEDDRSNIRNTLSSCMDILDGTGHPTSGIVNIYSGRITDDSSVNVHDSVNIGTMQKNDYEKGWPKSFHGSLKKTVKTVMMATRKETKIGYKTQVIDSNFIYARAMGITASHRDAISVDKLFSYELANHPTALFSDGGDMRKTNKSVLKSKLKIECGERNKTPASVVIMDGCALLWTIPWPASPANVFDYVNRAVATITTRYRSSAVVHVVFDRYHSLTIKSQCRSSREKGCSRVYKLSPESPLPRQTAVLNVTENKMQIIKLIVDALCQIPLAINQRVIVTGPDPFPIEVEVGPVNVAITHEEADVIMAYHMVRESERGYSPINVVSDDTDVLLILAHHLHILNKEQSCHTQVTMESCAGSRAVIDVNAVVQGNLKIMNNLLAAHALSGCDTVSSFAGIGKATVLTKLRQFPDDLGLGDNQLQLTTIVSKAKKFVSALYGRVAEETLNGIRSAIFSRKLSGKSHIVPKLCTLPPTDASFTLHVQRAHFQTAIWKTAHLPSPPEMDPMLFGWEMNGSVLQPVKMLSSTEIAPEEVMNIVSCGCTSGCATLACSCTKHALSCSPFCKCKGEMSCENPLTATLRTSNDDSDLSEEDGEIQDIDDQE